VYRFSNFFYDEYRITHEERILCRNLCYSFTRELCRFEQDRLFVGNVCIHSHFPKWLSRLVLNNPDTLSISFYSGFDSTLDNPINVVYNYSFLSNARWSSYSVREMLKVFIIHDCACIVEEFCTEPSLNVLGDLVIDEQISETCPLLIK
jgi:hypothetical protein